MVSFKITERDDVTALGGDIYGRIGVRTLINGRGATTSVGGTLMHPRVLAAMAEAAREFVVLDELNAAVGARIAEITGAEAGYVTSGSAAGMALAAAACIAGSDPARIRRLPESDGWANEIVIHRAHRINYDQMFRVGGGRIVEIGLPAGTERWELDDAIGERTAAVAWVDSRNTGSGALDFATVVEVAHARGVPVIVDAASTLPPVDHLRRWIRWGADLVIYSGGKGLRGPQDSGLLAGRRDLIEAAQANGSPHAGAGRGMKVSKEAMVGLWAAIDLFLETDHEAEYRLHLAQAETLVAGLADRADVRCAIEPDWDDWPAPVVRIFPHAEMWSPRAVSAALMAGDPAIALFAERGGLMLSTHCLLPGDVEIVIDRLGAALDAFGAM
jgi:L-seryl-tRNA(Ser) seleniumtransferase